MKNCYVVNYPTMNGTRYAMFYNEHKARQFGFKYNRACGWQFKVQSMSEAEALKL